MQVIIEADEAWSIMMLVVSQVIDHVELSEEAKAALRKWRSDHAEGGEAMLQLAEEMNDALGAHIEEQARRRLRRKGRYVSTTDL